jgi:heme-degrading monooxygenase HmoA
MSRFVRFTIFKLKEGEDHSKITGIFQSGIPTYEKQKGMKKVFLLRKRESNQYTTIAFWDSEEEIRQSDAFYDDVLKGLNQISQTYPETEIYEMIEESHK